MPGSTYVEYMMINPDDIKEEMARRGLVPEVQGLTPMEASELVHEESSHIAKRLAHRAHAEWQERHLGRDDVQHLSASERIDSLRDAGYGQIHGVFVDISVEVSARRADSRHRQGHDEYRGGIWVRWPLHTALR